MRRRAALLSWKGLAAALVLSAAGSVSASVVGTLPATTNGYGPSSALTVTTNYGITHSPLATMEYWKTTSGNAESFSYTDNTPSLNTTHTVTIPANFNTFCVEMGQWSSSGTFSVIWPLDDSLPTTKPNPPAVDPYRWDELNRLVSIANSDPASPLYNKLTSGFLPGNFTNVTAAAFQVAIWEIVYDSGLSMSSGDFIISSGNSTVTSTAQGWLNAVGDSGNAYGNSFPTGYTLVGLRMPGETGEHQDQITLAPYGDISHAPPPVVPLPGTVWMGALLLAGMIGWRTYANRADA